MLKRLLSIVLFMGMAAYGAAAQEPTESDFPGFAYHRIDNVGSRLGQTALADVDNDGDLDWVAGEASHSDRRIWWWEYRAPGDWVRHRLGEGDTDVGGALHDVDGDGDPDMLSGRILLVNTGSPTTEPFEPHDVGTIHSHDTEFADVDGDGDMDALANSDQSGLYWYEIPEDVTRPWPAHRISSADEHEIHGGVSPRAVGDIDGDGDPDVVTGRGWYENTDGSGRSWELHETIDLGEPHRYGIAVRTWVGDLDGDGDADVVQAEADNPDGRLAWFENDGEGNWTRHIIRSDGAGLDFHSLAVADFDLDEDLDVFSCGGPLSANDRYENIIWENLAGPNRPPTSDLWEEHVLVNRPCHEAEAADVDGDGDVDIASKPWSTGDEHYYLRNRAVDR